jgi:ABC-2 type transport system ATP-binding protein
MIEVKQVAKRFGKTEILSEVHFQVNHGGIFGLIGYNGAGKTTLLKMMCGVYQWERGEILIGGESVYENPKVKQDIFFLTEEATFFAQTTMNQMRSFYRGYYPNWSDATFEGLAEWFGIDRNQKLEQFSKGMQRQAGLTIAFASRAKYLLLDEAFDGLDVTMRKRVRELIQYYATHQQGTFVIASHNVSELDGFVDEVGMLCDGKLLVLDRKEDAGDLEEVFRKERTMREVDWRTIFPEEA